MILKAVIFDLDGVLCATDERHFQSWVDALTPYRIPFDRQGNEKLRGLTRERSLEVILGGIILPELDRQEILRRKNAHYLAALSQLRPVDLMPGVPSLLADLAERRINMGVASASQHVRTVLRKTGIEHYFWAICDGTSPVRPKPAPDPYLYVAAELKVDPEGCLVFEDSEAGVTAGLNAGMFVVGIGAGERVSGAYHIISSLEGIHYNDLMRWYSGSKLTVD